MVGVARGHARLAGRDVAVIFIERFLKGVSGMLYVCATPIGNLGDVTPRVLDALRAAELVAAEDTRHTRKLLSHFDIHTPLTSLFQHNEAQKTEEVLRLLATARRWRWSPTPGCPACRTPACGWSGPCGGPRPHRAAGAVGRAHGARRRRA